MRRYPLRLAPPALLWAACALHTAVAAPVAIELQIDNDQFAATPANRERGYTSGVFLRAALPQAPQAPDGRLLRAWCDRVVSCDSGSRGLRVLSLEHSIWTPRVAGLAGPNPDDRPFAATLAVGVAGVSVGNLTRQALGLQLGVLGPAAGGESFQNGLHRLIAQPRVVGWDSQVRAQPVIQLSWSRVGVLAASPQFDTVLRTAVQLGTPVTQAGVGALIRIGDRSGGPTWPGDGLGTPAAMGWTGYAGAEARVVARDETIDGDTSGYTSAVRHRPGAASVFAGFGWPLAADWELAFTVSVHTVPFSPPGGAPRERPQRVGSLVLRWSSPR